MTDPNCGCEQQKEPCGCDDKPRLRLIHSAGGPSESRRERLAWMRVRGSRGELRSATIEEVRRPGDDFSGLRGRELHIPLPSPPVTMEQRTSTGEVLLRPRPNFLQPRLTAMIRELPPNLLGGNTPPKVPCTWIELADGTLVPA